MPTFLGEQSKHVLQSFRKLDIDFHSRPMNNPHLLPVAEQLDLFIHPGKSNFGMIPKVHNTTLVFCEAYELTQLTRFMGPTWGPHGADRTQESSMSAPWTLLSLKWMTLYIESSGFPYTGPLRQ